MAMYAAMMSREPDAAETQRGPVAAKVQNRPVREICRRTVSSNCTVESGVTEECPVGHYYRRLTMIDILFRR